VSPTKTAEPIETSFGIGWLEWAQGTIHWMPVQVLQGKGAMLGVVRPTEKHRGTLVRCTQKRLNWSRCRLGADTFWSKEPCIRRGSRSANPFETARDDKSAMRPFAKLIQSLIASSILSAMYSKVEIDTWMCLACSWKNKRYVRQSPNWGSCENMTFYT